MKLEVDTIGKNFAGLHALRDVSVNLEQGDILAVIGPNGSGKTTMINVVSGVIRPTSGEVRLNGTVLTNLPSHRVARAGVARTFQNIRLFKDMTVIENVEVAASKSPRTKGWLRPRRVSREALAVLGLEHHTHSVVGTLAYGLQRRVEIARAIATRPHFLLLDEPAAGLNEAESDELLDVIRSSSEPPRRGRHDRRSRPPSDHARGATHPGSQRGPHARARPARADPTRPQGDRGVPRVRRRNRDLPRIGRGTCKGLDRLVADRNQAG